MRRRRAAVLAAAWLAAGAALAAPDPAEPPARRFETLFVISLPFTTLYAGALTVGLTWGWQAGVRGEPFRFTPAAQAAAVGLALAGSAWIAWRDARAPNPIE